MQNCGMPPSFLTRAEGLRTQTGGEDLFFWSSPNFGPKIGLSLSEDHFFFFWSSPDFRQKKRIDCGCKNFHSGLSYSQIF